MKYLKPTIFGLVMLLYLWYPYSMIQGQEQILQEGAAYRFKPRPVDPVDAFRGRYIILGYDNFHVDYPNASDTFQYGQKVYANLAKDTEGYAYFTSISTTAPTTGDFIFTTCQSINNNRINLEIPDNMRKYFLNEAIAPEAERVYVQLNREGTARDSAFVYIDTKVLNGTVLLEKLFIKDQTVEDYIRSQAEN